MPFLPFHRLRFHRAQIQHHYFGINACSVCHQWRQSRFRNEEVSSPLGYQNLVRNRISLVDEIGDENARGTGVYLKLCTTIRLLLTLPSSFVTSTSGFTGSFRSHVIFIPSVPLNWGIYKYIRSFYSRVVLHSHRSITISGIFKKNVSSDSEKAIDRLHKNVAWAV